MIDKNYNEKFRTFFKKFFTQYEKLESIKEKDFLWKLAVYFVEKNRDFVMQYPLVNYWEDILEQNYEKILKNIYKNYENKTTSLYFHIPFCKTKCTYCNFHIIVWDKNKNLLQKIYIKKIKSEIDDFIKNVKKIKIDTIYIWWWTPSYLDEEDINDLLKYILDKFWKYFLKNIEFCFESNPDSLTENKIKILKKYWVNRISLWVQTFDNKILKKINRTYTKQDIIKTLDLVNNYWFEKINIDIIYWLPWSNYNSMKNDLEIVKNLPINHLTYYPLYYYEDAILSKTWNVQNNIDFIYDFYDEVVKNLKKVWFKQYWREYFWKNWNTHKYHNNHIGNKLFYWFGVSAYSFSWKEAFLNEQNLEKYLINIQNIKKIYYYNNENLDRRLFTLWIKDKIINKVNINNIDYLKYFINILIKMNLIKETKNSFKLTYKWLKYQDLVSHIFM